MCILEFLNLTIKKSTLQIVFACLNIGSKYPPSEMHLLFKFYQILLNYSHHCTVRNSNFLQTNLESPGKINFYKKSAALNSSEYTGYEGKKMQKAATDLFWAGYSYYGSGLLSSGCTRGVSEGGAIASPPHFQ